MAGILLSTVVIRQRRLHSLLTSKHSLQRLFIVYQQPSVSKWNTMPSMANKRLFSSSTDTFSTKQARWSKFFRKKLSNWSIYAIVGVTVLSTTMLIQSSRLHAKEFSKSEQDQELPTYTAQDVSEHNSELTGIWVSYGSHVYDITDFIQKHPGGEQILLAAGSSLEPFWLLYSFHQSEQIINMLEVYRIGVLSKEDQHDSTSNMSDPYASDPIRHAVLIPSSLKPFNAEPPLQLLAESHITPTDIFYVRNHLPVPHIDPDSYELEVVVPGHETVTLSLEDLKSKFKKYTIVATIQCAGNRRNELTKVKPVKGLSWGAAAISTASWSGARLREVLQVAGLSDSDNSIKHIQFEGCDLDTTGVSYGASILRNKAMDPIGDVLIAYEMNGSEIPVDHGYPVRLVAPGIVGARSVKWLARIVASEEESSSHWQQNDYKGFSPSVDWDTVDFKSAPAIQVLPVQSAICNPINDSVVQLNNGLIEIKGYAWSGGGCQIVRVDVTADDGHSWYTAVLEPDDSPDSQAWAWRLWKVAIPISVDAQKKDIVIMCKAVDSSYNSQPDSVEPIWNLRGVLNNAWHRVNVTVKQ